MSHLLTIQANVKVESSDIVEEEDKQHQKRRICIIGGSFDSCDSKTQCKLKITRDFDLNMPSPTVGSVVRVQGPVEPSDDPSAYLVLDANFGSIDRVPFGSSGSDLAIFNLAGTVEEQYTGQNPYVVLKLTTLSRRSWCIRYAIFDPRLNLFEGSYYCQDQLFRFYVAPSKPSSRLSGPRFCPLLQGFSCVGL